MKLDDLLAQSGHAVERPPLLWEVDAGEAEVRALLAAFPPEAVINASNVVVPPEAAGENGPPAGEFVAITAKGVAVSLPDALVRAAGSCYAYARPDSITVFLRKLP